MRDDVDDNRLMLIFPDRPAQPVVDSLKRYGFRWSPTNGAWQRQRGNDAMDAASVEGIKLEKMHEFAEHLRTRLIEDAE